MLLFISLQVEPTYGRKMMKGYLAQKYKVNISQNRVTNALKIVAQTTTRDDKRIPQVKQTPFRIELIALVTNYMWINEKLEMYVVVHVVAIDGHSRYITCGATMSKKNNKVIYAEVYRFILFLFYLLSSIVWRVVVCEMGCFSRKMIHQSL